MTSINERYAVKDTAARLGKSRLESTQQDAWTRILVHQLRLRLERYSQAPPAYFHWVNVDGDIVAAWPLCFDGQAENCIYLFQNGKIGWAAIGYSMPSYERPAILSSYIRVADMQRHELGSLFDSITSDPDSADYACYKTVHWHQPWAIARRRRIILP